MTEGERGTESHALRGPIDRGALLDFRTLFERQEPLATGKLDDRLDPRVLRLSLADGIGEATSARIDVAWTTRDDYTVHYSEDTGTHLRWDVHPHGYPRPPDDRHFHPPPAASSDPNLVRPSCIRVRELELVARATQRLWRSAYDDGSFESVNDLVDPP